MARPCAWWRSPPEDDLVRDLADLADLVLRPLEPARLDKVISAEPVDLLDLAVRPALRPKVRMQAGREVQQHVTCRRWRGPTLA